MDTNRMNEGNMDVATERPTSNGVRPAGVRPAGARPAGTRPAGAIPAGQVPSSGAQVRPTTPVATPNSAFTQKQNTPQPAMRQPVRANTQAPMGQSRHQKPAQSQTTSEHVIKSSEHQRVIESIPVKFDTDPNKKNYVLYMIIDKPIDGMLQYFRSYGLNVSKIFSRIEDARSALMMQVNPARIVIVDTGNGAFNSMSARKQVIDVIGLGDEENKVTIFYSDTNLKYEIEASKEIQKKALSWYKYKTTTHLLACMLQSKDCNYISDGGYKDASSIVVSLDETLWRNPDFKDAEEHNLLPMVNSSDVAKLVQDQTVEQIQRFTPIIR